MSILTIVPMFLLSGTWTPPEAMPEWPRHLMEVSPLYYFVDASYGILLRGAGLDLLWNSVLVIHRGTETIGNPGGQFVLCAGDGVIALGRPEKLVEVRELCRGEQRKE